MSISAPPRPDLPNLARIPLELATPRVLLRPLAPSDVDDLWPYVSDPELPRQMSWAAHRDRDETREFIERQVQARERGTDVTWAIVIDGRVCGCVGLHGICWEFRAWRIDRAELGYWIGKPFWNQGYMTEIAAAVTHWAFDTLRLHKLTIGCIEGNLGSKRVIEKTGFRFLALAEDDVWRDGRWWSHLRYELTAAEWGDSARTMKISRLPPTS